MPGYVGNWHFFVPRVSAPVRGARVLPLVVPMTPAGPFNSIQAPPIRKLHSINWLNTKIPSGCFNAPEMMPAGGARPTLLRLSTEQII
jgi:hypothetical protein